MSEFAFIIYASANNEDLNCAQLSMVYQNYENKQKNSASIVETSKRNLFSGKISRSSICIDTVSNSYVIAYQDNIDKTIHVRKIWGNSWTEYGYRKCTTYYSISPIVNDGWADNPEVVKFDTVYVSYRDLKRNNAIYVKYFYGYGWQSLGLTAASESAGLYQSMYCGRYNWVYIAYQDSINNYGPSVRVYNQNIHQWEYLGTPGMNSPNSSYTSLVIDRSDYSIYIAYIDGAKANRAVVKKYNGTDWDYVDAPLSTGAAEQTKIVILNGTPYVIFKDLANGGKATVMMYK